MRYLNWFLLILIMGCVSQKPKVSKQSLDELKKIVVEENIEFTARNASPLRFSGGINTYNTLPPGSNQNFVNLANISNYMRIFKDSISMDLPFFGGQRIINAYSTDDNSFIFNQRIEEKSISFDRKKQSYTLNLWVKGRQESLRINFRLFPNHTASIVINSTLRNAITYRGEWIVIKTKTKG